MLLAIRHGSTAFNAKDNESIRSWLPVPLSPEGHQEVQDTAEHLKTSGLAPVDLYSSDLPRAVQSADVYGQALGVQPQPHAALRDWHLGDYSGQPVQDVLPHTFQMIDNPHLSAPNGESYQTFADRATPFLKHLVEDDQLHAVVTHNRTMTLLHALAKNGGQQPDIATLKSKGPVEPAGYLLLNKDWSIAGQHKPQPTDPNAAPPEGNGISGLRPATYEDLVRREAQKQGVDPDLAAKILQQETSGGANIKTSPKGAQGPMQLMPGTAAEHGVQDPTDTLQNIRGGVAHLKELAGQFPGRNDLVAAAYNAGAGAVQKAGGVPNYPETQKYVQGVTGEPDDTDQILDRLSQPAGGPPAPTAGRPMTGQGDETDQLLDHLLTQEQQRQDQEQKHSGPPAPTDSGFVAGLKRSGLGQAWQGVQEFPELAREMGGVGPAAAAAIGTGLGGVVNGLIEGRIREGTEGWEYARRALASAGHDHQAVALAIGHLASALIPGWGDISGPAMDRAAAGDFSGAAGQWLPDAALLLAGGKAATRYGKGAEEPAPAAETAPPVPKAGKAAKTATPPPPKPTTAGASVGTGSGPVTQPVTTTHLGPLNLSMRQPPPAQPTAGGFSTSSTGTMARGSVEVPAGPPKPGSNLSIQKGAARPTGPYTQPAGPGVPQPDLSRVPDLTYGADVETPGMWKQFVTDETGSLVLDVLASYALGKAGGVGTLLKAAKQAAASGSTDAAAALLKYAVGKDFTKAPALESQGRLQYPILNPSNTPRTGQEANVNATISSTPPPAPRR